jgi:hypothetical protein
MSRYPPIDLPLPLKRLRTNISSATLEYLHWFESPITFDRMDHPNNIAKSRRFPLIVDPLVGMTRLTKVLMDGGNGINLMYLNTFKGLGLTWDQLKSSPHPFYKMVPNKQFIPLEQITLLDTFGDASNYHTKSSLLRWSTSPALSLSSRACGASIRRSVRPWGGVIKAPGCWLH